MIVHECNNCKKISANRIAGDDESTVILEVFDQSEAIKIASNNLTPAKDRDDICTQLFGKGKFDNKE